MASSDACSPRTCRLMLINLLLLMAVSFLPFPTNSWLRRSIAPRRAGRGHLLRWIAARHLVPVQRSVGFGCPRPASASARGERERVHRDCAGSSAECGLLCRRDRARDSGPKNRRSRLSRHRRCGRGTSEGRNHTTRHNRNHFRVESERKTQARADGQPRVSEGIAARLDRFGASGARETGTEAGEEP